MILGSSVAGIDSTVVAVALPAIGRNLHVGFQDLQWTVMSYTLTLASLILLAGSLSDRWGRRRVFLIGLGWFTLASVLCAAAPSIGWLIAARAVQGVGGGLHRPGAVSGQLRPDQLDLRGGIRLRRGALRTLHHRISQPHPGTTAGGRPNSGASPRLPDRLRATHRDEPAGQQRCLTYSEFSRKPPRKRRNSPPSRVSGGAGGGASGSSRPTGSS